MPNVDRVDPKQEKESEGLINRAKVWDERISNANKYYDNWANQYEVELLERYYYGDQWNSNGLALKNIRKPYVSNQFWVAIDIKTPSLLFSNPVFTIKPRPARSDFDPENSSRRAFLRQEALNYFATSGTLGLGDEAELCILDAWFRFGIMEVGYSADWIENPNAGKPLLKSDIELSPDNREEVIRQPARLPQNERIYVKYIPSRNFRVGGIDNQKLDRCSWYGYWEFVDRDALIADPNVALTTKDIGLGHATSDTSRVENVSDSQSALQKRKQYFSDVVKVWYIWDNKDKRKLILLDDGKKIVWEKKFKRRSIFPLKFRNQTEGFWPVPPTANWKMPQDEINENREAGRAHRQRFKRKYLVKSDFLDADGEEQLQYGPDGAIIKADGADLNGIKPIEDANLGAQHSQSITLSRDDFDNIAGVTAEQRGQVNLQGSRTTATQANLIDQRASIRETRDQTIVANWFCEIGKEVLLQAKERLSSDFWIPLGQDSEQQPFALIEQQDDFETWTQINSEDFGDEDFDVTIEVSSLSPVANDAEKRKMLEFLAVINTYPQFAMDPVLIREFADRVGYRNEKVIRRMQKMASLMAAGLMQQLEQIDAQAGGRGSVPTDQVPEATVANAQGNSLTQALNAVSVPQGIQ